MLKEKEKKIRSKFFVEAKSETRPIFRSGQNLGPSQT